MAKRSKFVKPADRHILEANVVASKQISPNFVRVTIGGVALAQFAPMGGDQWFRLFLPQDGQSELRLPTQANNLWYAQYLLMSKDTRPVVRNYTVRDFRAAGEGQYGDTSEIDIDFVSHGDGGPASAWAAKAAPGDQVAFLDEGLIYNPTDDYEWQLIVGDESALPAIMGILHTAPEDLKAEVFIEIPHADDAQTVDTPAGVNIHWVVRTDSHTHPGLLALAAVQEATLPAGPSYTYIAGERELATSLRRHLVNDRKFPKSDVTFTGYWRFGKAQG